MITLTNDQKALLEALADDEDPMEMASRDMLAYLLSDFAIKAKLTITECVAASAAGAVVYMALRLGFKLSPTTPATPIQGTDGTLYSFTDFMTQVTTAFNTPETEMLE